MVEGPIQKTFVRAAQEFFSEGKHGRKVLIPEFKDLTTQDKIDLSRMLNDAGFSHIPYTGELAK